MCGIAGIWRLDGRSVEQTAIRRFVGALAHRGPDGEGVLMRDGGSLALAHRRLAILDLSAAGDQPMTSPGGRYDITYNGEVYNFLELRAELEGAGFEFRSQTDTEVILAAFERWGPDALLRFNGMWSFAIWDRDRRALFLSRDRFGVKPLYVTASARLFAFASELKAFLHLDGFEPTANVQVLKARLASNFDEGVLLRDVDAVPPGHWLEVTANGIRRSRWWNTLDHLVSVPRPVAAQAEEFRELLFDACRLRVRSDVPVVTALSGGLDSSSVLCSLAASQHSAGAQRQAPDWRRAFIAGFPDTVQDETEYALLAAERAGASPVVHQFSGDEFEAHVDSFLYHYEEIGALTGIAPWALYREMRRQGVIVSIEGHGGDELLAGYTLHILMAILRTRGFLAAPRATMSLIETLQQMYDRRDPERPSKAVLAAMTIPAIRAIARRLKPSQRMLDEIVRRHSYDPGESGGPVDRAEERAIDELGPLTGALYRSFHCRSLPRILRNFDVYSMSHGIEARMPLLDWRVVCYAFSTSDASKAADGYAKRLLREAMRGVLPEAVRLRRDKKGYNAPVADWLNRRLGNWVWDQVNDPEFIRNELWDGRGLLELTRAKRRAGCSWSSSEARRVTRAVTAHWWQTRWLRSVNDHPIH